MNMYSLQSGIPTLSLLTVHCPVTSYSVDFYPALLIFIVVLNILRFSLSAPNSR